jgi:hypothetical protein
MYQSVWLLIQLAFTSVRLHMCPMDFVALWLAGWVSRGVVSFRCADQRVRDDESRAGRGSCSWCVTELCCVHNLSAHLFDFCRRLRAASLATCLLQCCGSTTPSLLCLQVVFSREIHARNAAIQLFCRLPNVAEPVVHTSMA